MEIHGLVFRLRIASVLCCCLFYSCTMGSRDDDSSFRRIEPLKVTMQVEDLEPYISHIEVFPIGRDTVARPGISKIVFSDPIVFLSGGIVFYASSDWQDIKRLGNVGRGPSEYLSIKDISINAAEDEIWCLDVLDSILRYDLRTGTFLGRITFDKKGYVRAMIPKDQNSVLLYTPNPFGDYPRHRRTFYCLNKYDLSGRMINQELPWTQFNVMASFSIPVAITDRKYHVLTPESSNISYIFENGGNVSRLMMDFGNKWIPSNYFNPKGGDPAERVGELFSADYYKLIASVFLPEDNIYFHAFGNESSSWNYYISKDGTHGIRWKSVGIMTPPISAVASNGGYLYFLYDDYGYVTEEKDPLKKYVIDKYGMPEKMGPSYLIKVRFDVK